MGSNQGVYVGGWVNPKTKRQEYLRHNGPEHVICYAPTRSGKGVGLVLPTLLAWPHSTVVYDIKGENFALTAGWRGHAEGGNNTVLRFSPVEIDAGIRFNPLNEIRYDTLRDVSDAQTIAQMVCFTGSDEGDHWAESAASLITGLILHIGYVRRQEKRPAASLRDVAAMLNTPGQGIRDTLQQMLLEDHDPTRANKWRGRAGELLTTHPIVSEKAQQMLDKEDKELSGVLSTAATRLSLYADPIVAANTGGSDFKINDLMNSEKPVSLYIVVPPSDKERLRPLVRLMFTLIVNRLTEKMDFKDGRSVQGYKHRLLCMVDEFPSLGKMEVFSEALAFCAGYGIKMYLITQDRTQLVDKYGDNESVTGNCHVRIAYAPNNFQTAEWLSGMTGEQTILKASYSYSGDRMSSIMGQVSANVDEVKRSLLTPDECMRLPGPQKDPKGNVIAPGDMLVFVAGFAPVYGKQILYFLDPVFAKRAKIAAPEYTRTSDEIMPPTLALTSPDLSDDEQAAALHFTDDSDHHGDDLDADPEAEHQPTTEAQA
jgi:type IV secretion system protein VirD4